MARGQESALAAAFKTKWDATNTLTTNVPGGLWWERVPQTATVPYALLKVRPKEPQFNSSNAYIQPFDVELTVYSEAGPTDAGGTIQDAIGDTFDPQGTNSTPASFTVSGAGVLRVRPSGGEFGLDDRRRQVTDVVAAKAAWEVTLQLTKA